MKSSASGNSTPFSQSQTDFPFLSGNIEGIGRNVVELCALLFRQALLPFEAIYLQPSPERKSGEVLQERIERGIVMDVTRASSFAEHAEADVEPLAERDHLGRLEALRLILVVVYMRVQVHARQVVRTQNTR